MSASAVEDARTDMHAEYDSMQASDGGVIYVDIPAWRNALEVLQGLGLNVVRVADRPVRVSTFFHPDNETSVSVYFENEDGDELGCWTAHVRRLQVFARPRLVHESMREPRTLWEK